MPTFKSDYATGVKNTPVPGGAELMVCRASLTFASGSDVAANDLLQMMDLPANCVPVDLILDTDDFDSSTTGTVSVNLGNDTLSGGVYTAATDIAANPWLTTQSIQAATGVRADAAGLRAMSRVTPDATRARPVFIKIVGETTPPATERTIGLTLFYRAAA